VTKPRVRFTLAGLMAVIALLALPMATYRAGERAERLARPMPVLVYITKTGTRYHRPGCRYAARGSTAVDLVEVRGRYKACLSCRPPL
jgi:hypothetical protein